MNSKEDKAKERIDLGLGAILAGIGEEREVEVSIDLTTSRAESSAWILGDAAAAPRSEFDLLADERKWGEIVRRTEQRLSNHSDVEARLWWIRGHLGAFSMPVSFLAAPLESLCRDIQGQVLEAALSSLLRETGLLALSRLEDVGDKSVADGLRRMLESVGIHQPRGQGRRQRVGTSSFRSLNLENDKQVVDVPARTTVDPVPSSRRSPRQRLVWTVTCLIVVVALLCLDQLFPQVRSPTRGVASESFIQEPHGIELSRPIPERREPGGRLGALFYSLDGQNVDPSGRAEQPARSVSGASNAAQQAPPLPGAVASVDDKGVTSSNEQPKTRESLNMEGPLEGPEFRDRTERERPRASQPRREELRGGPPQAVLPGASPQGFENQKTYRVIARTSVLSAPSYGGRVIGQLDSGDRVLVEGKLGRWLRLRSKKGRGGYVLAADVEEIPDL